MAARAYSEEAFFGACDEAHRAFFGDLMARWRAAGHSVKFQSASAALSAGKVTLCSLYPEYRGAGGAARLNLQALGKEFGGAWAGALADELRAVEGLQAGKGSKELVIREPARSSLDAHEAFKQALLRRF